MKSIITLYKKLNRISVSPKYIVIVTIFLAFIPITIMINKVLSGDIALWYDPARDLLSAIENLQKPTLIGPTSGIPGIFYGPYWIWLLSFGQLFSTDVRYVTLIALTIPYLVFFPLVLIAFRNVFRPSTIGLLFLLFILTFPNYFTDLWNPYPAPLFLLLTILLIYKRTKEISIKNCMLALVGGFSAGLTMNFHLAFGIAMIFGIAIFFIGECIFLIRTISIKKGLVRTTLFCGMFALGLVMAFTPFFLFELRHGFQQTHVFYATLTQFGGTIALKGLDDYQILQLFFGRFAMLLHVPFFLSMIGLIVGFGIFVFIAIKKSKSYTREIRLMALVVSIIIGVLSVYLTARNPVWQYHFIAVEILFLLLLGLYINKLKAVKAVVFLGIIILVINYIPAFQKSFTVDARKNTGNLAAKEEIVRKINQDSNKQPYTVYAYSPSIYIYEYTYLFKQIANKDVPYDPGMTSHNEKLVYLIIPEDSKREDFINYRAPEKEYKTLKIFRLADGTEVIKKIKK